MYESFLHVTATKNDYNVCFVINTFNRMSVSATNLKTLAQRVTYSWLLKLVHYTHIPTSFKA